MQILNQAPLSGLSKDIFREMTVQNKKYADLLACWDLN